jgi:hypothetical protein
MENSYKTFTTDANKTTLLSTNTKAGIYTSFGLIFYFMAMRFFNFHHYLELHYFNIVVLFLGIRYTIKHIILTNSEIKYFEGLKAGLVVTLISIIIFNGFLLVYETIIDPPFLEFLKENISFGQLFSLQEIVFNVMGIITIEGLSSGFILTYILMQYYKANSSETK